MLFRSTGASADLEYIRNHTTNKTLHFNPLTILPGESWLIDLRPGRFFVGLTNGKGVTSNVAPYSDVAEFYLLPGANTLAMYASTAPTNITVFIRWVETYWSID